MAILRYNTNQALIGTGFNQPAGSGFTLTLSGNTTIASSGTFQYATDRGSYFDITPRAVPDVGYVTGLTSAITNIGSSGEVVYRSSSGITGATGFIYDNVTSGVTVPNLCISETPATEAGDYFFLTWDSGTTKVNKMSALSVTGIQGATNGLGCIGDCVCLGGVLIDDTKICGNDLYSLTFCGLCGVCAITTSNNIVFDARCNSGGIYMKSQSGTISSPVINYNNSVGIVMDYPSNIFKVYDNRIGANQRGIEYDDNYSTFFTIRSLVDKGYVDAIAAGLQPHPAVLAATTGNTILSGLTGTTIIDGILIGQGDRVLIKNQIDEKYNGIYILTGTTFTRATDFDESSESVQGAYTFVLSGTNWQYTSWILSTPNPITIDITPLTFSLFNQITDIISGTGITISKYYGQNTISVDGQSLVGNSLSWNDSSCQFDVNVSGGTLSTALSQTITGATNIGAGTTIYSGTTARSLQLHSFVGSGGTTIQKIGDEIIVCSNTTSGGQLYSGQTPSAVDLCGISIGYELTGKTVSCILQDLLVPELCGTITNPSIGISLTCSGIKEIGCVLSQTVTGNYNQGCINPQYCSASDKRNLTVNAYEFTGTGMPSGFQSCTSLSANNTNATHTVVSGSQSWGVCARYDSGTTALSSKGTPYGAAPVSGCTNAASGSITGIYPYYYGKLTSGSRPTVTNALITTNCMAKCVLSSTSTVTVTFNSASNEYTWVAIPQVSTSKTCWYVNALDNGLINNSPSDKYPDECIIAITSAEGCWASINYKVYMSGAVGEISSPIQFRNS